MHKFAKLGDFRGFSDNTRISSWNGFSKSDHNVLDGNSFSLYLRMKDDNTVEASGYMRWPKNYEEVKGELISLFDEYKK